jgi:hypothetical protein
MYYFIGAHHDGCNIEIGCTFLKAFPHFYFWLVVALLLCLVVIGAHDMTAKPLRVSLSDWRIAVQ